MQNNKIIYNTFHMLISNLYIVIILITIIENTQKKQCNEICEFKL